MVRKTSEELQEAKRQRAEERRLEEAANERRRAEQEQKDIEEMENKRALKERYIALSSYVNGIYDEVNKLSAKRSSDPVSYRMLERANRAIKETRSLLADENDPFLDEIEPFVPAGDDVEARDVVLTLRQVKDALERMRKRYADSWSIYH